MLGLMEIAAMAMDECAVKETKDAAISIPKMFKKTATPATPSNHIVDLDAHDKAKHGGHFDPKTMSCKYRENMAKSLIDSGKEISKDLAEKIGAKNIEAAKKNVGKEVDNGGEKKTEKIEDNFKDIEDMASKLSSLDTKSEEYKDLKSQFNAKRDEYIKQNLDDKQQAKINEFLEAAKDSSKKAVLLAKCKNLQDLISTLPDTPENRAYKMGFDKLEEQLNSIPEIATSPVWQAKEDAFQKLEDIRDKFNAGDPSVSQEQVDAAEKAFEDASAKYEEVQKQKRLSAQRDRLFKAYREADAEYDKVLNSENATEEELTEAENKRNDAKKAYDASKKQLELTKKLEVAKKDEDLDKQSMYDLAMAAGAVDVSNKSFPQLLWMIMTHQLSGKMVINGDDIFGATEKLKALDARYEGNLKAAKEATNQLVYEMQLNGRLVQTGLSNEERMTIEAALNSLKEPKSNPSKIIAAMERDLSVIKKAQKEEKAKAENEAKGIVAKPMKASTYNGPVAPTSLLGKPSNVMTDKEKAEDCALDVWQAFDNHNVKVDFESVETSPTAVVAKFKVPDTFNFNKLSDKALTEALAAGSGAQDVSLERVKGEKNSIKAIIKKPNRDMIRTSDVVETNEWKGLLNSGAKLPIAIGKDHNGKVMCSDLRDLRHLQITGESGSGKSVSLNTILTSLGTAVSPKNVRYALMDLKGSEFVNYSSDPHLGWPIATREPKAGADLLASVRKELEDRKKKVGLNVEEFDPSWDDAKRAEFEDAIKHGGKDLAEWNEANPGNELPYIVVGIDEFAALSKDPTYGEQATRDLSQILALGRSLGIHCIVSTQRATVDSIPGECKANIPSKMAFKSKSAIDSVSAIEHGGAEHLTGKGDGIFVDANGREINFQGAFTGDKEINAVQKFYRDNWRA